MSQDQHTYQRAANAALVGLAIQFVLALAAALLGLYSGSVAINSAAWHLFGGLPIWGLLVVLYHQHRLERIEALEIEQLSRNGSEGMGLFEKGDAQLGLARGRLQHLYKWGLGFISLTTAMYLLVVGFVLISNARAAYTEGALVSDALRHGVNTATLMAVTAAMAFISFIVARYESGMAQTREWQLLRGGAGYLMGNCLAAGFLFVGTVFAHYGNLVVLTGLRLAIPVLMVLVGGEIVLTFVLGSYCPRRPGEVPRPAFDSRMLGWMTSPGSIAKAIGEAINYQFGFEVSRSWFYRLLSHAVTPLVMFGIFTLVMLSSLVIVGPHEEAIITRFGAVHRGPVGAGLHLKLPWPIDAAEKFPTGRVHQVLVGSTDKHIDADHPVLWSTHHAENEEYLVTAWTPWGKQDEGIDGFDSAEQTTASGHSLVGIQVVVQYRVADLMRYITASDHGREMLTVMAEHRLNAYCASQDIDTLLGPGRADAGGELCGQIQTDCDKAQLGVEVIFVGLTSVHPPQDMGVAAAFLEQIGAMQERQSMIERAQQEAAEALASVAGSRDKALEIDQAIVDLQEQLWNQKAPDSNNALAPDELKQIQEQEVKIERLLTTVRGEAAKTIYEARADRWERAISERAKADRFTAQIAAYRHAPAYYRASQYLNALSEGLGDARKYVLASDQATYPVFRLDLKDAGSAIDTIFSGNE